jgi:ribonucleotide monophosphatase NagD (HAD superfamily)
MFDTILLDMDGVLYHGDLPLSGATEFLEQIQGIPHRFITNNPILPPGAVADKLARLGLPKPSPEQIITSAQATARCLMIGDRPETDIAGAARLGMQTALVRTGRFAPGETLPEGLPHPDWDVENLPQLLLLAVARVQPGVQATAAF